ncbi:MAG TPA: phosphoribosylanthranilate isomerase [Thermomicrobiales bacterium]|nr:phosphoribosylanthranilate isomerase [Thermomicrobiales bacterium]
MTLIKICGIREAEHALVAIEAGADMLGLVFYPPSPRFVTIEQARAVRDAVREADPDRRVRLVGLFVNEPPGRMNAVAAEVGLDLIQLSGDEPPSVIAELDRPAIASIRIDSSGKQDEERRFRELTAAGPLAVHVDAHVPGMYGGTGTVADWFVATDFAQRYPVILAGGLTPETAVDAVLRVKPFAVDVSSGVETNGVKDSSKIRVFIAAARSADRSTANAGTNR